MANNQNPTFSKIDFILTHKCNLHCTYCLRESGINRPELEFDTVKEIIKKVRFSGQKNCTLTGGEAALYSRFWDLLTLLGIEGFNVFIESNGVIINPIWLNNILNRIDRSRLTFLVSLDSHDNRIHDASRGPGRHQKAVEAIKLLRDKGIRVYTNSVLHKKNFFPRLDLQKYLNFLCDLGVNVSCFSPIVSIGNNRLKNYSLTYYETSLQKQFINESKRYFSDRIEVRSFQDQSQESCRRLNSRSIVVSYKGFHPCLYLDDVVVDTLEHGLQTNFNFVDSLPSLKKSVDITMGNSTNACWACCQSFNDFYTKPPFKLNKRQ